MEAWLKKGAWVVTVIPQIIVTVHTNIQGGLVIHTKSLYIGLICGLSISCHHTSCRNQACCIDGIWNRTNQIPVCLKQFEPVHILLKAWYLFTWRQLWLKKFTRYLTKKENDTEVLNVNSIASERTAFCFMHDQQEWVLVLGGCVANKR
jgi:hypothetical protein